MKSLIIPICLFLFFVSCNMMNGEDHAKMSEEEAQKAIIGTWELTSYAMYLDEQLQSGIYYICEFLPDGLFNYYSRTFENSTAIENGYQGYTLWFTGTYTIEKDILVKKYALSESEGRFKYRFFENGDNLELINADWKPIKQNEDDNWEQKYSFNIRLFRRINISIKE